MATFIDEMIKKSNTNDFIITLDDWLCKKCGYGEHIDQLTEAEKVFFYNQTLEREVNSGGYHQFFSNPSGDYTYEILDSLRKIGANATAAIHEKAIAILVTKLGRDIPKGHMEREDMIFEKITEDDIYVIFDECDADFNAYEDNLNDLNYQFVIANKEQFN